MVPALAALGAARAVDVILSRIQNQRVRTLIKSLISGGMLAAAALRGSELVSSLSNLLLRSNPSESALVLSSVALPLIGTMSINMLVLQVVVGQAAPEVVAPAPKAAPVDYAYPPFPQTLPSNDRDGELFHAK